MMDNHDIIIIGAGFSGSVIAREMAEQGANVLLMERRDHIAGNMYDYYDKYGILLHKYGPHTFHTCDERLIEYISRFAEWEEYKLTCMVHMDRKYTPSPFNFQTLDDYYPAAEANRIKEELIKEYNGAEKTTITEMLDSNNAAVKEFADFLFEKDYRPYTAKQWGIPPEEIDVEVLRRVPVVLSYKTGYFDDTFQCMPKGGYTRFFERLLDHPKIRVLLGVDGLTRVSVDAELGRINYFGEQVRYPVVYTGPIDELLGFRHGELPYRSLRFEWKTDPVDSFQDAPVVAYPQEDNFTRITEYKKLPVQDIRGVTTYAVEFPLAHVPGEKSEPYYPVLSEKNNQTYQKYRSDLSAIPNLYLCGRLAEYKYYNMDQALKRALDMCEEILR